MVSITFSYHNIIIKSIFIIASIAPTTLVYLLYTNSNVWNEAVETLFEYFYFSGGFVHLTWFCVICFITFEIEHSVIFWNFGNVGCFSTIPMTRTGLNIEIGVVNTNIMNPFGHWNMLILSKNHTLIQKKSIVKDRNICSL